MREVLSNSPADPLHGSELIEQLADAGGLDIACDEVVTEEDVSPSIETQPPTSTLIEFPGSVRQVPEWRKQLSQRVREVQERKAREAAEEAAAAQEAGTVNCILPSAQLELVPNLEQPSLNPIVSKVLERLERARRPEPAGNGRMAAATAPALAPLPQDLPEPESVEPKTPETKPKLTVVAPAPPPPIEAVNRKPVRVITDRIDDVALSYLENCLSVPALQSDFRTDQPGRARRIIAGLIDLLVVGLMVSPVAAVIHFTGGHWSEPRVFGLMGGVTVMTMFAYFTISIALTGRTLAMRMLSLRTIDLHTGLIPTGGQSIKRAIAYIFSLIPLGLGLLFAFVDPDGRAIHDRFSKTMVIRN